MIKTTGLYHAGIPVDDLDRAERFYTSILGMEAVHRHPGRSSRLKCGDTGVVLFVRPRPLNRDTLKEDGDTHQAFEVAPETFDKAVAFLKSEGYYHEPEYNPRERGRAVYFFDSEGNYLQLHTSDE